jgi:hypothetical protein
MNRPVESFGFPDEDSHSFRQPTEVVKIFSPCYAGNVPDPTPKRSERQAFDALDCEEAYNSGCGNRSVNHNGIIRHNARKPAAQFYALDASEYAISEARMN